MMVPLCPVCLAPRLARYANIREQGYLRCDECHAVHLEPQHRLSAEAQLRHYRTHRNEPDDPDYRRFLSRLAIPLLERLKPGSRGLDYGCGPGPALAAMLREAGHAMNLWDPFFAPDPAPLEKTYDFVTCTEVAEHFDAPAKEFARLATLLEPDGWLAIMTMFLPEPDRFAGWHYHRDPTHVVFYSPETFRLIAARHDWRCTFPAANVVLLQKCS